MASDSNITMVKNNKFRIQSEQVSKTEYFKDFNLGVSIWGKFKIDKKKIWDFIKENIDIYFRDHDDKKKFPYFLEEKLNESLPPEKVLQLDERKQHTNKLGIHLSTYLPFDNKTEPVLFHVTNDRASLKFEAQTDISPSHNPPPYIVFNGVNEPFFSGVIHFRNYLQETSKLFREIIDKYSDLKKPNITSENKLEKELKLIITTIKQYQAILEYNGLKAIIGGRIEGICFNQNSFMKKLTLGDF